MASELIIDLENQRYADREFEGEQPASRALLEQAQQDYRAEARVRLLKRVREPADGGPGVFLDRSDLLDLLVALGLYE